MTWGLRFRAPHLHRHLPRLGMFSRNQRKQQSCWEPEPRSALELRDGSPGDTGRASGLPALPPRLHRPQWQPAPAITLSIWTLSLTLRRRSELEVAPPLLGDHYDSKSTCTSTPNQGLPSGDRVPVKLSFVWTKSWRESCRKAMADNKAVKPKETSKTINNKTRFFSPIPEKRLNHLPSLSIENDITISVKD